MPHFRQRQAEMGKLASTAAKGRLGGMVRGWCAHRSYVQLVSKHKDHSNCRCQVPVASRCCLGGPRLYRHCPLLAGITKGPRLSSDSEVCCHRLVLCRCKTESAVSRAFNSWPCKGNPVWSRQTLPACVETRRYFAPLVGARHISENMKLTRMPGLCVPVGRN